MRSHAYAAKLRELAEFFESRPDFDTECQTIYAFIRVSTKENLVESVNALKPGTKSFTEGDYPSIYFQANSPKGTLVRIEAPRDLACRKVKEAVWECEPLLQPEEIAVLGQ